MREHVANAANAFAAAPANILNSTTTSLRARFAGVPNADAPPWSAELWQHKMPPPESAPQAIVPAPPAPPSRPEPWRQWQEPDPRTYDYEAEAKRRGEEYIRNQAAKKWR
jgi:hypothetical protein